MFLKCPECGAPVRRVPRSLLERIAGIFTSRYRYHCRKKECDWQGLLNSRSTAVGQELLLILGVTMVVVALVYGMSFLLVSGGSRS
ncbi:hypothetical protein [Anthocerotibacter panamensis]|uniref:hypothetical protein n=1 Tax=Anthocerotibacter panamensis TaxID=2857077 RepID=UPI001C4014BC|nr:hypothetical protein [Anthocerotibacter panamensis]